jgi:hypothetical protein
VSLRRPIVRGIWGTDRARTRAHTDCDIRTVATPAGASLRLARPTDRLAAITVMYAAGLDFAVLAQFYDHNGFDGVIFGHPQYPYHLEFTTQCGHQVGAAPTEDLLLVFYTPDQDEPDARSGISPCSVVQSLLGCVWEDVRGSRGHGVGLQNAARARRLLLDGTLPSVLLILSMSKRTFWMINPTAFSGSRR